MALRILIVDDSLIFRHAVAEVFAGQPGLEVVGSVRNGEKALEFLAEKEADLVTLDLEMPGMDGLETLEGIRSLQERTGRRIGVLMVSSHTVAGARATVAALENGAFDFVTKPEGADAEANRVRLRKELLPRVLQFAKGGAAPGPVPAKPVAAAANPGKLGTNPKGEGASAKAIVIGVSTGGPRALVDMLPELCRRTALPILIVQHMPAEFTRSLADSLSLRCSHAVREGRNGERIEASTIYIAPGGQHMEVAKAVDGQPCLKISDGPPENGCRPAADVLFRTAGRVYGKDLMAVVLTGMGNDGSASLPALKASGAVILAQDEATSVVWGMPGCAVATGVVDDVLALMDIPAAIQSRIGR